MRRIKRMRVGWQGRRTDWLDQSGGRGQGLLVFSLFIIIFLLRLAGRLGGRVNDDHVVLVALGGVVVVVVVVGNAAFFCEVGTRRGLDEEVD